MTDIKTDSERLTPKGMLSRNRIIDTAMTQIRTRGYAETTIQGICSEVGIGVGTFYHYFRSKEEVLMAFISAENQDLLNFYANLDKSSYSQALLAVADHYIDMYFYKGANLVSHVYSMLLFSKLDFRNADENAFSHILHEAFVAGQKSGEFSKEIDADFFGNLAMGEWFYFTSLWCNDPERFNIRERIHDHYQKMLIMVSTPRQP